MTENQHVADSSTWFCADLPPAAVDALARSIVLRHALASPEFVAQFDRLRGTNLGQRGASLDVMIDGASGRLESDFNAFVAFVRDVLWDRAPEHLREDLRLHVRRCAQPRT